MFSLFLKSLFSSGDLQRGAGSSETELSKWVFTDTLNPRWVKLSVLVGVPQLRSTERKKKKPNSQGIYAIYQQQYCQTWGGLKYLLIDNTRHMLLTSLWKD